jgi:hypothetical protein
MTLTDFFNQKILHAQLDYYCPGGMLPPLEPLMNHYADKNPMAYPGSHYDGGYTH